MNALITQGSTGTHSLERALKGNLHQPRGWNHHERNPRASQFEPITKTVYLFCNPYDYVLALFRIEQRTPGWITEHVKNTGGQWQRCESFFRWRNDIESFLRLPGDPLGYLDHAQGYLYGIHSYSVLSVRYEQLQRGIKPLCDFWGIDVPKWEYRRRLTDWTYSSPELLKLLESKYGNEFAWYQCLNLTTVSNAS